MTTERDRALQTALGQIERAHGKGAIMRLGEVQAQPIDIIPTGALTLDIALGVGGVPRGRIIEVYGPESSGKTTLTLHIIAEAQKRGGVAAFIDAEHALDPQYASRIGVRTEELLISQPDTGEQALEIVEVLVRSGAVDVVVIDSVAALVPKAEIDGEMGDSHVGLQARLMSQAMRKLDRRDQPLQHLGHLHQSAPREDRRDVRQSGGHHRREGAEVLRLRAHGHSQDQLHQAGTGCSRQPGQGQGCQEQGGPAVPLRPSSTSCTTRASHMPGSVLDMGIDARVIEKSGAWFSYGDMRLGQGRENVRDFLRGNPDLLEEVATKVRLSSCPSQSPCCRRTPWS